MVSLVCVTTSAVKSMLVSLKPRFRDLKLHWTSKHPILEQVLSDHRLLRLLNQCFVAAAVLWLRSLHTTSALTRSNILIRGVYWRFDTFGNFGLLLSTLPFTRAICH